MNKRQLEQITDINDVYFVYCQYNYLRRWYEEHYGGPHGAGQYKEYFALRDSERACANRFNELKQPENGGK